MALTAKGTGPYLALSGTSCATNLLNTLANR